MHHHHCRHMQLTHIHALNAHHPHIHCTHTQTYTSTHTHTHMHTHTHTHTYTSTQKHTHIHTPKHAHPLTCTPSYTHTHTYPHIYTLTHINVESGLSPKYMLLISLHHHGDTHTSKDSLLSTLLPGRGMRRWWICLSRRELVLSSYLRVARHHCS